MIPEETTVLIVGGGPSGLVASQLLSRLGVPNVVVERRAGTQKAPAAHVIRQRPLSVLAELGLEQEIRDAIPPLDMEFITWVSTLGGPEIGRLDIRDRKGGAKDPFESAWVNLSQNLLEPILARAASRASAAEVVFAAECVEIDQDAEAVSAVIRLADGSEHRIRSRWAIAADGAGSPTRSMLGVEMVGTGPLGFGPLGKFFMVHFKAPLSPWTKDRSGPLYWILNPESLGTIIVHAPDESYVYMTPTANEEEDAAHIPARLAAALGVPVEAEIISMATWVPFNQVAEHYRVGRAFFAGDAAHRFPPTGGLGLNTGILDVYNLVWKLALVDAGLAGEGLLDSYELECRPAAVANADQSFGNLTSMSSIMNVIGAQPSLEALEQRLTEMTQDERTELQSMIDGQRSHFESEGSYPAPVCGPGDPAAVHWRCGYDGFTLFAVEEGPWREIAKDVSSKVGVAIGVDSFATHDAGTQLDQAVAFMTRPDGIVVWRSDRLDAASAPSLESMLRSVLDR